MEDIKVIRYSPEYKQQWDEFVESSKNGTFLFLRGYMEYHSDRFEDHSLLFYRKEKLYCLFPACVKEDVLLSHGGLTYGGLVMNDKCTAEGILNVFRILKSEAQKKGFSKIIYKPVPHIYHKLPSEEDLYGLFRNQAKLSGRNISCTIDQFNLLKFSNLRRRMVKRSESNDVITEFSNDFDGFWQILEYNLKLKYGASPVHSLSEIKQLAYIFPDNIKLCVARKNEKMIGGVVCYLSPEVVHLQYISADEEGKKSGAIDAVICFLLNEYKNISYFDLGTSNEDGGKYLNESLIHQKEGFGGRAICYDTYTWDIEERKEGKE